jgi:hypothetical protein
VIFFFFGPKKLISGQEDMKLKKNAFPTFANPNSVVRYWKSPKKIQN